MSVDKEAQLKKEIISIGKKLYALRLVTARSGNLSVKLSDSEILVTATGSSLGSLRDEDIIRVDLSNQNDLENKRLTSEFPLHSLIYKNFSNQAVIHCHPALINGYFSIYPDIQALTFETKLYLGNVPVIEQDTPSVTKPQIVIDALKQNNLVVLRHHGIVSMGDNFQNALNLIETLEEAVKSIALARLFKKEMPDSLDKELKEALSERNAYTMFSKEHIQAIVDLVNKDEFISRKGQELDLTLKLSIKLDGTDKAYKFNFEKGRIIKLEFDENAPFIISAGEEIWQLVFLGKLDPFVAVTQGRMKLQGQLAQLSRWYVPFSRLFELFKQVKLKREV
jgi:L-fuculose-phosphate aldolase